MLFKNQRKVSLNIEKNKDSKSDFLKEQKKDDLEISGMLGKQVGESDEILNGLVAKGGKSANKFAILNESNEYLNDVSSQLFKTLGIVTVNDGEVGKRTLLRRVETYLKRFPEVEYLIDMIASSTIYTSSSNTKKIEVFLNGEHTSVSPVKRSIQSDTTSTDTTSSPEKTPNINVEQVTFNTNVEKVDSYYKDISVELSNLFQQNNAKLSLYNLMFSIVKYGCGIFYIDDPLKFTNVSFYGLDEVNFTKKEKRIDGVEVKDALLEGDDDYSDTSLFKSLPEDDHIKVIAGSTITVSRIEDGRVLNNKNLFFVAEKGIFGKSLVDKVVNYLKIIELLELSLLIERLSKSKTTFVWKIDLAKVEEDEVAQTLMLYRNLIKSKNALNYDENGDSVSFDIVKNLVDNNVIIPTENDNLKIDTLKSEYKPLLDDIDYWQDKVYNTMGIPLHYRKGISSSGTYTNTNMLSLHDNVYAMKIRHYQVILNNILTFQINKWMSVNYKDLKIKYLNVNLPEFVPISDRKETDLDKATKFVTMFTQLEQMLGMTIKNEFIINKLFPNDLITDILDTDAPPEEGEESPQEELMQTDSTQTNDDIMSLFESGTDIFKTRIKPTIKKAKYSNKKYSFNKVTSKGRFTIYNQKFDIAVKQ